MAKRLGFRPDALIRARPGPKHKWKLPVNEWVRELYRERFGQVLGKEPLPALLDLVYANISTFKDHVDPTYLGVSYYLAAINVPAMVVVHVVIFVYLLRRRPGS